MTLILLALALLLQTPSAPPRDGGARRETGEGKCVLRGRVLDGLSGRPIRGAIVTAYSEGRDASPPSTSTNDEGRWELRGLVPGEYHVSVEKPGFTGGNGTGRSFGLTDARPERAIDLTMNRGAVLSGRIVDAAGEPMPGIEVTALSRDVINDRTPQWNNVNGSASTDDRGDFRIFGLAAGEYLVAAKPQNRLQQTDNRGPKLTTVLTYYPGTPNIEDAQRFALEVAAEHSDLIFSLQEVTAISIRGRVLLPPGQVAESIGMLIPLGADSGPVMGNERLAEIKRDGTFAFTGVPAGNYHLSVRLNAAPGEERIGELDVTAAEEDIADLVVPMYGPTVIRGRVILPSATEVSGPIGVTAFPIRQRIQMMGTEGVVASTKDGTFELKAYHSPVRLHAYVRSGGWAQAAVRWKGQDVARGLSFDTGQPVEGVEILLRRTSSRINGAVSDASRDEQDNEGIVVLFQSVDDGSGGNGIVAMVPVRDGRFATGVLPAGDYQAVAVRAFDRTIFSRPEQLELLRARATDVSVGDNETKAVSLTLLPDY